MSNKQAVTALALVSTLLVAIGASMLLGADGASADFLGDSGLRADDAVLATPAVSPPGLGDSYVDPVFDTRVRRLTLTPEPGSAGGAAGTVPEYSKAQAWNADDSLFLLRGTDGSSVLYDGQTLGKIAKTRIPVGDVEPRWSPVDPDLLTYVLGDRVFEYSVRKRRSRRIGRYRGLGPLTSGAEQERSADGRYFALHGPVHEYRDRSFAWTKAFVVDLKTGRRGPVKVLRRPRGDPGDFLDYVAVTPDGKSVMVMWAAHGADLYSRRWRYVRRLTNWDEHGDFCRDANGQTSFVVAHYRADVNDEVVEAVPLNGEPSRVLWRAPVFNLALHISCRNTALPGWAFLSSYWDGIGLRPGPTAFESEVFALGLSSTVEAPVVRRLAHTQMIDRADYFDEPHATVRRDGRVVLFASYFGRFATSDSYDDTYAIDLR
ncbi:MAG: hypothetical protein HY827_07210 [Actinobacteria bacterium]|nr:hypothetical protein [Actinomycetota bacterium]